MTEHVFKLSLLQTVIVRGLVRERMQKLGSELRLMERRKMSEQVIQSQKQMVDEITQIWRTMEAKGDMTEEVAPEARMVFRTPQLLIEGKSVRAIDVEED